MKFFIKLIKSVILSIYWHKALNAVYKNDYKKALRLLEISEYFVTHTFGNNLLKGWVLFRLDNFDESIASMNTAIDQLQMAKTLNYDEKLYLEYYAGIISNTSIENLSSRYQKRTLNNDFDIENVSLWHRNNFPIPKTYRDTHDK